MDNRPITPWYRRQLIVNKSVQFTLLMHTFCVALLAGMSGAAIEIAWRIVVQNDFFSAGSRLAAIMIILISVSLISAIIILGFFISNRIVGPVFRLKAHMKAVIDQGERAPIRFRQNDHFKDVADEYNQIISMLPASNAKANHEK